MSARQCERIVSAITRQPWAITPEGLDLVLGVAQRHISDPQAVLASPAERREGGTIHMRDGIAILSIMGPIFPRADFFTNISGATSIETLALRFGEALAAPDVKGIVLHIDSPGGQITGVHEFAEQVFAARSVKPVVAYISGAGASAAYWIASAAGRVVADATAVLGSIGVVAAWTDEREARRSRGLTDYEVVSSQSPNKRLDPASAEGRDALQRLLDATADIFIADVARNRGCDEARVTERFGRGGVMLAAEAVRAGMADAVGSLENVIAALSGADGANKKEAHMDAAELSQKYPELLADIRREAAAQASLEAKSAAFALVAAVAGEETAEKVRKIDAAGVTPEQVAVMSSFFAPSQAKAEAKSEESDARKQMLEAIASVTGGPLPSGADVRKTSKSPLVADAERRAAAQRM
ncbi:S49 family peptidase [uncultured Desulfovibrio sp.]|uniref:S49 family peptidase n=1 Tax=uncultured Desulfovibrio sp. TaxID=167968 RepID=UPI0026075146|nr:S49 family peptidase [uncultured Desulfovibrio sp.]